jgi:hypothetical protein
MATTTRSEAQRNASRRNGARSTGPRSAEGRGRSSLNRTVHGLNSTRLLLATEDVAEYREHVEEWIESLLPATAAERQIVLLVADLMWRLKRIGRIEERLALALLDDIVEQTPESQMQTQARELATALDTPGQVVATAKLPVPTTVLGGFLGGVRGIMQMVDTLHDAVPVELWPEAAVCAFVMAEKKLDKEADVEVEVTETFTALGKAATALAAALRGLDPALAAAVEKARTAISTDTLLADDEDRRFERHRRILDASVSRQLDLLAKVKAQAQAASASGSFERPPAVELRVVRA